MKAQQLQQPAPGDQQSEPEIIDSHVDVQMRPESDFQPPSIASQLERDMTTVEPVEMIIEENYLEPLETQPGSIASQLSRDMTAVETVLEAENSCNSIFSLFYLLVFSHIHQLQRSKLLSKSIEKESRKDVIH